MATCPVRLDSDEAYQRIDTLFKELEAEGTRHLKADGFGKGNIKIKRSLDMRYVGQVHECTVEIDNFDISAKTVGRLKQAFNKRHEELYTYSEPNSVIEVVNLESTLHGVIDKPAGASIEAGTGADAALKGSRKAIFTPDGKRMLVSIGSASNVGEKMSVKTAPEIAAWEAEHGTGAAWDGDTNRAPVSSFDPEGKDRRAYGTGIRNCVGLTVQPATGVPWCTTNERDLLGDNLVPDYVTRVKAGGFYGWPWFYIGAHPDVRKEPRPDLAGKVIVPDVLLQPHSAALQTVFYPQAPAGSAAFPAEYNGQAFTALHGSWNRSARTGYKVVRLKLRNGSPTGEYEDFLTGFVLDDQSVWGRPVGVAVAADGALIVSEDGNGMVWRVAPTGK